MKQADNLIRDRINRAEIAPFVAIAIRAAQTEIVLDRFTPMFFSIDVIYLMSPVTIDFSDQAILAAFIGTVTHLTPQFNGNIGHIAASFSCALILSIRMKCSNLRSSSSSNCSSFVR